MRQERTCKYQVKKSFAFSYKRDFWTETQLYPPHCLQAICIPLTEVLVFGHVSDWFAVYLTVLYHVYYSRRLRQRFVYLSRTMSH
jgi:hypothetical protein